MEIETTESSCHRCPVCTDRIVTKGTDGDSQSTLPPESFGDGEPASDLPPEGMGLVVASLLLFFAPAALGLAGTITLGQTATMQWLGGIGGFSAGMIAAVCISKRVWNTAAFDISDTNRTAFD